MKDRRRAPGTRRYAWLAVAVTVLVTTLAAVLGAGSARTGTLGALYAVDARGSSSTVAGPAPSSYPWHGAPPLSAHDPWGFSPGQCTSYVAWWLNTHAVPFARLTRGPAGTGEFHDAAGWDAAAARAGFTVSPVPAVGSIAQWHALERSPTMPGDNGLVILTAGVHGHVAVVTRVLPDGSVETVGVDGGSHHYVKVHTRAPRYLWIGLPVSSLPGPDGRCSARPPSYGSSAVATASNGGGGEQADQRRTEPGSTKS